MSLENETIKRVLIYRLGSIGDLIVALPCLHLIARSFPNAERRLLTTFSSSKKEAPASEVIGASGLIHSYLEYPIRTRNIRCLLGLRTSIVNWSPDVLIYLTPPRGQLKIFRDALFFYLCGIKRLIGVPYSPSRQKVRSIIGNRLYESEAHRLARCVQSLGSIDLENPNSWELYLRQEEMLKANQIICCWSGAELFMTASIGTKAETKNWGMNKWSRLFDRISTAYPKLGLVLLGSQDEYEQSDLASVNWCGPKLNLCGTTAPRISAAVIKKSILFVGHDSGPMHLAAAMNIRCVAIFSARNKPGEWFPHGNQHSVIYKQTDCYGCRRTQCIEHQSKCIKSITVDEVFSRIISNLNDNRPLRYQ